MNYAFIKNNICFNIAVFDDIEIVEEFKIVLKQDGIVDDIPALPEGFGIGDKYEDGVWTKAETIPELPKEPTIEDYLVDLDFRVSLIELGV